MRDWFPFPEVKAFTSYKKARKYVKRRTGKVLRDPRPLGLDGQCTVIENRERGDVLCVVVLLCEKSGMKGKVGILGHECAHVVRAWLDMMEAESPDEETVAYGIQAAMLSCIEQIGEEWFYGGSKA